MGKYFELQIKMEDLVDDQNFFILNVQNFLLQINTVKKYNRIIFNYDLNVALKF